MKTLYKLIIILFFTVTNHAISQTTYTSANTGDWNNASTWSPSGVPQSGDPVIIGNHTVTVTDDATCTTVTTDSGGGESKLIINALKKLTVSGSFVVQPSNSYDNNTYISGTGKLQVTDLQVGLATITNTFPTTTRSTTVFIDEITEFKITGKIISTTPVNTSPSAYNESRIRHRSGTIDIDGVLSIPTVGAGPILLGYRTDNPNQGDSKIIFRNAAPFTGLAGQIAPNFTMGTVEYLSTATNAYTLPAYSYKNLILNSNRTFTTTSGSTRIVTDGKLILTRGTLSCTQEQNAIGISDNVEIVRTGGSINTTTASRPRLLDPANKYKVTYNQHTTSITAGNELLAKKYDSNLTPPDDYPTIFNIKTITVNTTNGVTINTTTKTEDLIFNASCSLLGSGKIRVINLLDLPNASSITVNDGLINLISTSQNTARVAILSSTASITGKIVVERYLENLGRKWRLLTAPVKGGSNNSVYGNWQNNGIANGINGAEIWGPDGNWMDVNTPNNGLVFLANSSYNIRKFNNTTGSWSNVTNTTTEPLFEASINKGFFLFVTHPFRSGVDGDGFIDEPLSTTLKATGELITGNVTYNNILNNKFYMIGNPYASPINFASILEDSSNSGVSTIWFIDPIIGTYGGYNTYSTTDGLYSNEDTSFYGDTVFQSGQAFFVRAKASIPNTSITIKEIHKSANTTNTTLNKASSSQTNTAFELFRIQFKKEVNNEFLNMDGCVAVFKAGGSNDLTEEDSSKISNPSDNLALFNTNSSLSIESRNLIQDNDFLTLKVTQATAGVTYKLKLYTQNFTYTGTAYLQDLFLGTNTALPLDGSVFEYNFQITTDALSYGNRFKIVFQSAVLSATEIATNSFALYPNPANPQESVTIVFPTSTDTDAYEYKIYNNLGQLVQLDKLSKQNSTATIPLSSKLISGLYFVQLHNTNNNAIATKTLLLK
jgi:hypothetical protein